MIRTALLFILPVSLIITSCKKDGCTDVDAYNYDEKAEEDDNSCKYESDVLFWYDAETASHLADTIGTSQIWVYIDSYLITQHNSTSFWPTQPTCEDETAIHWKNDMGFLDSETITYEIKDDWGNTLWTGGFAMMPNQCHKVKLQE